MSGKRPPKGKTTAKHQPPSDKELADLQMLSSAKPILTNEINTRVDTAAGIARLTFGYAEIVKFQQQPRRVVQYNDSFILTEAMVRELRERCDRMIDVFDEAKPKVIIPAITQTDISSKPTK